MDAPTAKPRLLFVSPQFLFPMDAGGKIRTANILKRLKGRAFHIDLISPAAPGEADRWAKDLQSVCDEFHPWPMNSATPLARARRIFGLFSALPVSIWTDATDTARRAVSAGLARQPALVIYDYIHAMALAPPVDGVAPRTDAKSAPHIVFTHNVETEIFRRHADVAKGPMRYIYHREAQKMAMFEQSAARRANGLIAVSDRDASFFKGLGARHVRAIPTGVDLDFFTFQSPAPDGPPRVVFTGSMDWRANQDGLSWFMEMVWPRIIEKKPTAKFVAIGKNPPAALVAAAARHGFNWRFTGFVDDVRDHARGDAYVIPLRVGGGTRIKAYEAMAMGVPVVSTTIGVEGLTLQPETHYLQADEPAAFAASVIRLLDHQELATQIAAAARGHVEAECTQDRVARVFEQFCVDILNAAP